MKKLFSLILVTAMLLSLVPFSALPVFAETTSGTCGDNVTWSYSNGTLYISGSGEMTSSPWNSYSYAYTDKITNIVIGEGVTSIAGGAFKDYSALTTVSIPSTVTVINDAAFQACSNLKNVSLPSGLQTIGVNAFSRCTSFTEISIPASVTTIEGYAFNYCYNVSKIYYYPPDADVDEAFMDVGENTTGTTLIFGNNIRVVPSGMFWCSMNPPNITKVIFQRVSALTDIERRGFYSLSNLETIIYGNTSTAWANITMGEGNDNLTDLVRYHTSCSWTNRVVTKAATCTQSGTYTEQCSICEVTQKVTVPKLGHTCSDWTVDVEPECEAYGSASGKCERCSVAVYKDIDPTGHFYGEWETISSPDCVTAGTDRRICSVCGDVETKVIDALGHTFGDWFVSVEPTCTAAGESKRVCSVCDAYETEEIAILDHTLGSWFVSVDPTCESKGESKRTCTECDYYETKAINALGHTAGAAATCVSDQVCIVCSKAITEKLGHNYTSSVTLPTCIEQGYTKHTCTRCEDSYKDTFVDKLGHTYGTEADCINDQICTVCKEVLVEKTGHKYINVIVDPTCVEQGYTKHTCEVCEYSYNDTYVSSLGHDYSDTVVAPTCTERGYTVRVCRVCEDSYNYQYVSANGHTYGAEADCENDQICTVCETVLEQKTGHWYYKSEHKAPACTEQGYSVYECSYCGDSYTDDYVSPNGHNPSAPADCTNSQYCYDCDEVLVQAYGHNYEEIKYESTCTTEGYTLKYCTECDYMYETDHFDTIAHTAGDWTAAEEGKEIKSCTVCGYVMETRDAETEGGDWILGDVNASGAIDMMDYILLKRNYFGTFDFDADQLKRGDCNRSGAIDMMDYILLKRAYFGTFILE